MEERASYYAAERDQDPLEAPETFQECRPPELRESCLGFQVCLGIYLRRWFSGWSRGNIQRSPTPAEAANMPITHPHRLAQARPEQDRNQASVSEPRLTQGNFVFPWLVDKEQVNAFHHTMQEPDCTWVDVAGNLCHPSEAQWQHIQKPILRFPRHVLEGPDKGRQGSPDCHTKPMCDTLSWMAVLQTRVLEANQQQETRPLVLVTQSRKLITLPTTHDVETLRSSARSMLCRSQPFLPLLYRSRTTRTS